MKRVITTILFIISASFIHGMNIDLLVTTYMSVTPGQNGVYYSKNWYYDNEVYKHKLKTEFMIYNSDDLIERLNWLSSYGLRGQFLDRELEGLDSDLLLNQSTSIASLEVSDIFNILHLATLGINSKMVLPRDVMPYYISAAAALNNYNQSELPNLLSGGEFIRTGNENYSRVVYLTLKHYLERNSILPIDIDAAIKQNDFNSLKPDKRTKKAKENKSYLGEHLLLRAIENRDLNKAQEVIKKYKPNDSLSFYGLSFVHLAATANSYDITQLLLENEYSPNKNSLFGITPLWAVSSDPKKQDIQKLLIEHNADINTKYFHKSIIFNALKGQNYQLVNKLIDMKANISGVNFKSETLLDLAFDRWDKQTSIKIIQEFKNRSLLRDEVKYIKKAIKKLNYEDFSSIINSYLEVKESHYEEVLEAAVTKDVKDKHKKVDFIFEHVLPPDYKLKTSESPLFLKYIYNENSRRRKGRSGEYAPHLWDLLNKTPVDNIIQGNDSLLYALSQRGSKEQIVKAIDYYKKSESLKENSFNTFRIVSNLISRGYGDIIQDITPYLSNEDFVNQDGWTILTFITMHKNYKQPLKALVEAGFNPNLRMKNGNHLISRLAKHQDYETILWLADIGAKIESPMEVSGFIPSKAVISDAKACIEKLDAKGAILK